MISFALLMQCMHFILTLNVLKKTLAGVRQKRKRSLAKWFYVFTFVRILNAKHFNWFINKKEVKKKERQKNKFHTNRQRCLILLPLKIALFIWTVSHTKSYYDVNRHKKSITFSCFTFLSLFHLPLFQFFLRSCGRVCVCCRIFIDCRKTEPVHSFVTFWFLLSLLRRLFYSQFRLSFAFCNAPQKPNSFNFIFLFIFMNDFHYFSTHNPSSVQLNIFFSLFLSGNGTFPAGASVISADGFISIFFLRVFFDWHLIIFRHWAIFNSMHYLIATISYRSL